MTASDLAAVLLGIVALVAVAALALVSVRLSRLTRELAQTLDQMREVTPRATIDLSAAADRAARQVDRLEDIIYTTGSIADRVDTATQVTFKALASPVIKGAAITRGTTRAARRLGRRPRTERRGA